ncbi:MAG: ABC transporter permease subunit [Acidimicrobiales bacterium]
MSDGARIVDQGYRPYVGPRHGRWGSVRVVAVHGLGRVLGLRRGLAAKILPLLIITISFLPAATFVGMSALIPRSLIEEGILPSYGEYYGYISAAIVIFVAFVAPDLLCTDRRTRMLGLLLASPLDRTTYLLAKAASALVALSVVTIGPPLLMLIAFSLEGAGPGSFGEWITLFVRIIVAGGAVAGVHTSLAMAASSFTDRNGIASAGILLVLLLSSAVVSVLINGAELPAQIAVFDLLGLPFELVTRIYPDVSPGRPEMSTALVAGANLAWFVVLSGVVLVRYRRLAVTR